MANKALIALALVEEFLLVTDLLVRAVPFPFPLGHHSLLLFQVLQSFCPQRSKIVFSHIVHFLNCCIYFLLRRGGIAGNCLSNSISDPVGSFPIRELAFECRPIICWLGVA